MQIPGIWKVIGGGEAGIQALNKKTKISARDALWKMG
jgi:hypothetical protein